MKKLMLVILGLLILSDFTFSQSTSTSNAPVGISIIRALSITNASGSLMFPEIIMNGTVQTKEITNANGVRFLVTGNPNRNITVTYNETVPLNNNAYVTANGGTQGTMTFITRTADQTGKSTTYTTPAALLTGATLPLVNDAGTGHLNIWVAGSISCSTTQPNGDYVGTFNITVTY